MEFDALFELSVPIELDALIEISVPIFGRLATPAPRISSLEKQVSIAAVAPGQGFSSSVLTLLI